MAKKRYEPTGNGAVGEPQAPAAGQVGDQYAAWREVKSGLHMIPLELVCESPDNARKVFDGDELACLAGSIAATDGINTVAAIVRPLDPTLLEAPLVPSEDETLIGPLPIFEIVGGHRRFRALQLNGATFIKAEVQIPVNSTALALKAFASNLHGVDLNPVEKSDALAKMLPDYKTVGHLAKALGMNDSTVQGLINLQRLIPAVKSALVGESISMSHAILISREAEEHQARALEACFRPETIDNGGGVEMVPKLVSERILRDWIKDHLRPQEVSQPKLFGTEEEQKEEAKNAALSAEGQKILDSAQASDYVDENAEDTTQSAPWPTPKAERSDDDLTAEQAAVVQPQKGPGPKPLMKDNAEFERERNIRFKKMKGVLDGFGIPGFSCEMARRYLVKAVCRMTDQQYENMKFVICGSYSSDRKKGIAVTSTGFIQDWSEIPSDEIDPKVVNRLWLVAMFIDEISPMEEPDALNGLLKFIEQHAPEKSKPKDRKAPAPSEVAKVMKAEKKKLENRSHYAKETLSKKEVRAAVKAAKSAIQKKRSKPKAKAKR